MNGVSVTVAPAVEVRCICGDKGSGCRADALTYFIICAYCNVWGM